MRISYCGAMVITENDYYLNSFKYEGNVDGGKYDSEVGIPRNTIEVTTNSRLTAISASVGKLRRTRHWINFDPDQQPKD